ncbi:MAG TPA: hypothetical protein VF981_09365 [Gemmatimonadaceae bacterium]
MKVYGYEMRGVVVWDYGKERQYFPFLLCDAETDKVFGLADTQAEAVRKFVEAVKR